MDSLRKCLKLSALRKALSTLPITLDDTYKRILSNLDKEHAEDASRILQWLCYSTRPMRLSEMVEVLAIDLSDDPVFMPDERLPNPLDILTICSPLVSVTAKSTTADNAEELRLAHFSVKEYLISERITFTPVLRYHITSSSANSFIAKSCLAYLLYFEKPITSKPALLDDKYPLYGYAAEFWANHYRIITDETEKRLIDLLGYRLADVKNECFRNWLTH